MKIVFMGTPDFARDSLEAIYNAGHDILAVVTNVDKPKGRGMKMIATPVKEFAIEKNLPVFQPEKVKKNEGGFWGNLLLPTDMIVGEYTLRGYTNWMRNANVNFFFQKNIPIANTLDRPDTLELKKKDISKNDFSVSFFPEGGHLLFVFNPHYLSSAMDAGGMRVINPVSYTHLTLPTIRLV